MTLAVVWVLLAPATTAGSLSAPVRQSQSQFAAYSCDTVGQPTVGGNVYSAIRIDHSKQPGPPHCPGYNASADPLGPCFVPKAYFNWSGAVLTAHVGDELRQSAPLSDMVVDVPHALAYLSRHLTLRPGDIILMGTPEGVGPLADGDTVRCEISGIGQLTTTVRRPSPEAR